MHIDAISFRFELRLRVARAALGHRVSVLRRLLHGADERLDTR
jgi:hypothetical protein